MTADFKSFTVSGPLVDFFGTAVLQRVTVGRIHFQKYIIYNIKIKIVCSFKFFSMILLGTHPSR